MNLGDEENAEMAMVKKGVFSGKKFLFLNKKYDDITDYLVSDTTKLVLVRKLY